MNLPNCCAIPTPHAGTDDHCKDDFPSKNKGFSLGTDDYMTKPVNLDEMVLRVRALLRRSHIASNKRLTLPHTILDYDALTVTWGDDPQMASPEGFSCYLS